MSTILTRGDRKQTPHRAILGDARHARGFDELRALGEGQVFASIRIRSTRPKAIARFSFRYFTISINLPKLSTTSYLTLEGAKRRFISSKNLRAHLIFVFSISRRSIDDIEPLVSATK